MTGPTTSTDPVRQYLQAIGRVTLLTQGEELILARQFRRGLSQAPAT